MRISRERRRITALGLGGILGLWAFPCWAANRIESVSVNESDSGEGALLILESVAPLKYSLSTTGPASRIEVRFEEDVGLDEEPLVELKQKLIREIKFVYRPGRRFLSALQIQLLAPCEVSAGQKNWFVTLQFKKQKESAAAPLPDPSVSEALAAVPESGQRLSVFLDDSGPAPVRLSAHPNLQEFINVGLSNHHPLLIAQKELKLAKRKLFESRRNFFPTVSARGTQSTGKTQTDPNDPSTVADFQRKEVGLEIGQTLFQSGRLYYSERQASVQREIAELQVERITLEVAFEVLKALYNYLQVRETLTLRKGLVKEGDRIVELTARKKEIGVASESEYLGVLSAGSQMRYRAVSQEKDLEIARTRLLATLNLDELPRDIRVNLEDEAVKPPPESFKLNSLLASAFANRPEVRIAQLTRKQKEYGRKVSRAENLFKVDASGFIGQSGAAFRNETLTMKDSYNVGLKGVLTFGGSSINPMVSTEKTAPDLGSNSRTETQAGSVTVGILDSLASGSNYLQAAIDEEKSVEELRKAKKDILVEVKEAFYNFQKAKLQIDSARKELEYRKKQAGIAAARDRLHQIEAPEYLQALSSLTEAEAGLKEAIGFYGIASAALQKAAGMNPALKSVFPY